MGPWTQADLDRWATEHGGIISAGDPDQNGVREYQAADGNFVVLGSDMRPRMNGFRSVTDQPQQQSQPPQSGPAKPQGGSMADRDPNAIVSEGWIDKKADFEGLKIPEGVDKTQLGTQFYAYQRTYKNGRRVIEWYKRGAGGGAGGQGDAVMTTAEDTVQAIKDKWDEGGEKQTAQAGKNKVRTFTGTDPKTGRPATVTEYEDGTFDYDEIKPSASQSAAPDAVPRVEGTPLPGGGFDNTKPIMVWRTPDGKQVKAEELTPQQRERWEREKNGGKTDKELADATEESSSQDAVPNRPGWVKITRKKGNDTKTVYRGPDGKEVDSLPEETKTGTKQFTHTDGKTYFEVTETKGGVTSVYVTDSAGNRVTLPGKESKTVTQKRAPNGTVYYEVSVEKDGKKETYTSSDPEGNTRIPPPGQSAMEGVKGVPSFTPDLTKPGAGLIDRQKQLDELMAAGKLTWEQRQAVLEQDIKTAQTVVGEFNSASVMLREDYQQRASQRGQDVQQANSRAALANTHYQNAVGLVEKFAPYLGVTPGDAGKLFMGMMASQLATATMYGGMRDVPREDMNPQLRGWAERTVGGALAPTAAAIPPGPGEAAGPAVDPQAAEKAKSQAMAEAQRASGQPMPTPLLGPQPVTAPVQPSTAPPPSTQPPGGMESLAPPSFIDNTVWRQTPAAVGMGLPQPMAGGSPAVGEALFGKSLPEPSSWRQDAEDRMYALTMPQQGAYGAGAGLFGSSLPPALTQPGGGIDYGLSMPQGGGGMDAIDAEARRQLAAAGVLV